LAIGRSLFPAHEQGQIALDAPHDDVVARVSSFGTDGSPDLTGHADTPLWAAVRDGDAVGSGERLGSDRRLATPGQPDPEGGLADLDDERRRDGRDPPRRRQPEEGRDDGEREEQF
jgi:hypothetical protein